jgi:hypothetical protein
LLIAVLVTVFAEEFEVDPVELLLGDSAFVTGMSTPEEGV